MARTKVLINTANVILQEDGWITIRKLAELNISKSTTHLILSEDLNEASFLSLGTTSPDTLPSITTHRQGWQRKVT